MQKVFKTLLPAISLSVLIGIGCRKQDQIIIHPNASAAPSDADAQNGANRFDSYIAQSWYNLMMKLNCRNAGAYAAYCSTQFWIYRCYAL